MKVIQPMYCSFAVCLISSWAVSATIDTVAGNGQPINNGDAGVATQIGIKDPFGVEIGPDGALYVTEVGHHRIRRVHQGRIATIAGTGAPGYSGDGGLATAATLREPYELRFDALGNLYFVEMQNHLIRRIDGSSGRITTVAGTGEAGFGGDGGPATQATFRRPHSIALDRSHPHLYVADIGNHRIRRVDLQAGVVTTIAGTGAAELPRDGVVAGGQPIRGPRALFLQDETLWIALREGHSVWRLDLSTGILHHVAGSGKQGFEDGPPQRATFNGPKGIAVDADENVYVVDTENHVIRRIDGQTREVTTIAGNGQQGFQGDGGPARSAAMDRPHGICLDQHGTLFIGDTLNHRVRRVR